MLPGMTTDIPPLRPPHLMPKVRTLADLERHWRALMGPLGFSERLLWMQFLEADGTATPVLSQITELPALPDQQLLNNLIEITDRLCRDIGNGTVAFLLTHPGSAGITAADRTWARALARAAQQLGVAMWPTHTADDTQLCPLAPDDLIESRGA